MSSSIIKKLPPHLVNQIAAGEVIERPSAVIKELIENAIDAKATQIDVSIRHGGKSYIKIKDNGIGMSSTDLILAFERHATSKLSDEDLFNIHTYGFRGEALPSIASISRMHVTTKNKGQLSVLELEAGTVMPMRFDARMPVDGTQIEIFDLFFATPARLKFLKADGYETLQSINMVKRMALANPTIGFTLTVDDHERLNFTKKETIKDRIADVWESTEVSDLRFFDYKQEGLALTGCVSVPTCHRNQGDAQYFFVNGRFVKDKIFHYALKLGYGDRIPPRRYPLACVFLTLPCDLVDVNVHPCKTEVRFLDESAIRRHLAASINGALTFGGALQTTTRISEQLMTTMAAVPRMQTLSAVNQTAWVAPAATTYQPPLLQVVQPLHDAAHLPYLHFGHATTQLFKTYIVSAAHDKTFIIDQHAAHERVVYEKYKTQKAHLQQQKLMMPLSISISPEQKTLLETFAAGYTQMGIGFSLQESTLLLESVPALIPTGMYEQLIHDTLDHLIQYESTQNIDTVIDSILATMACYNSIRKGQSLAPAEMDALLRQMEKTPNIAQCNHGRPTYTELKRSQLDHLFERT
ncbi:MAG: DNA mismatch repair endonuclease MutL [Pseudomonadota bacterium]